MSEYNANGSAPEQLVTEQLVSKGKSILELCLARQKTLCFEGFIDSQIERGGMFVQVVDALMDHVAVEMVHADDKRRRALLLDLQHYCAEQLRHARSEEASSIAQE